MTTTPRTRLAAWLAAHLLFPLAPLGALAQTAPAAAPPAGEGLGEVVVTARRRAENIEDVPVAVTAIDAATIEARAVTNLQDLNSFTPNFHIGADRATNSTINVFIRGVGQSDPLWGFDPGVGVYLDDVYLARPQSALLDVLDVDHLEVLRGPQGTLYGKNTIAGAIKYVSRDIAGPATLTASVTGGDFDEHDVKVSGSLPLIAEHVYFGLALADLQRGGYGEVVTQAGTTPSPYNYPGEDVSNKDVIAGRANLTFTWGESSKLKFIADTVQDNSHAPGGQRLNNYLVPALDSRYDTRTDMPVAEDNFLTRGLSATYTQQLSPALDLKLVGAYREGDAHQFIDFEELNANLFQVPGHYLDHEATGEGQLTYTNDLVKAVGGVYYLHATACGAYDASLGADIPGLPLTSITAGCVKTDSKAVYADTVWKLSGTVNLDAGLRWNQDQKTAGVYVAQYVGLLAPNQTFFDPASVPAGFILGSLTGFLPGIESNFTGNRSFSNVSPRLGLDWHLAPQTMAYISYSRGFKSGGFDMRGNALFYPATKNGYDSETADNYEAGVKATWLDDRLQTNLTVFYTPYNNVQLQQAQFIGATNVTEELNAGKQINEGVELETAWRATRALTLSLNAGYLDAYYQSFLLPCPGNIGCAATGTTPINVADLNRPINAPLWSGALNASYLWDLSRGSLLAHAGLTYRGYTKVGYTVASVTDQPAYTTFDAGLAYTTESRAWRFALEGKNLTDRWYRVAGYDFGGPGTGLIGGLSQIGFYGPPRTWTLTAQYHY
jgi:iron complex outermembrane recepter protein